MMNYNFLYWILLIIIGVLYPAYALKTGSSTKDLLIKNPLKKIYVYKSSLIVLLSIVAIIVIVMKLNNESINVVGLSFLKSLIWVSIMILSILTFYFIINKVTIPASRIEKLKSQYKELLFIVPKNINEYRWAVALSLVAGSCEELIFRGFLFWQISQYIPILPAIFIVNIVFGLCHWGTGLKNAMTTFILGMIWSGLYYLTGSLWLSILTHVLVDIYSSTLALKLQNIKSTINQFE